MTLYNHANNYMHATHACVVGSLQQLSVAAAKVHRIPAEDHTEGDRVAGHTHFLGAKVGGCGVQPSLQVVGGVDLDGRTGLGEGG